MTIAAVPPVERDPRTCPGGRPAATFAALMLGLFDRAFAEPAVCDALGDGRIWTWGEVIAAAVDLAAALEAAGLGRGDRLAHLGPHGPDWIVVDLASQLAGVVHVPLHADTPPRTIGDQLRWLVPRGLVLSGPAGRSFSAAPVLLDLRASAVGRSEWPSGVLGGTRWRRRLDDGSAITAALERYADACDPEACSIILLSSGTTGRPKGVMHCQRAIVANAAAAADVFLDDPRDVRLSWLPMSHSLARTGDLVTALVRGACLNVVTDRHRVLDACRVLAPTVVLGVPAFFERLEQAVVAGRITDLTAALGGRLRACVAGGAALRARTVAAFARCGIPLVQGYGLAEAGPVVSVANPRIARPGSSGPPLAGVSLAIDSRPATRGQLLVRTPCRAVGVIDETGRVVRCADPAGEWLETGDLAELGPDGHVRITGRVVDTIVLSTGTKLPPAEVEAALGEDPAVAQVCVAGDGLPMPVAIVVPEPAVLRAAMKSMGILVTSRRAAIRHPRVLSWLARRLARRQRRLPRGFRVRRLMLLDRPFSTDRGEMTASMKLRRRAIAGSFATRLLAATGSHPPPWVGHVPPRAAAGVSGVNAWAASGLWGVRSTEPAAPDGFAAAAEAAASATRDGVTAVVEATQRAVDRLRDEDMLYEPRVGQADLPRAPLDDAPRVPQGRFSREAETTLGDAGLWGLHVPERFGGTGCTLGELARVVTRIAANVPTAAGMLAVHSTIGAVSAVTAFGSPEQQDRHLPGLALGRPLSIFGATEPDAGCDLHAIRSRVERHEGRLLLSGTKMFITNADHGRLVKILALLDGRPAVLLVSLPVADTPAFRLRHYAIHPLKHARNAALEFTRHEVDAADILTPPPGAADGMKIVWHGLNRGRVTLAAQAAGTLHLLASQTREHARTRCTWGQPIASRELVQGRLARIAAGAMACRSLAAWAAAAVDAGQSGELEAIVAKVVASEAVREGAIASLGVHGGRAFLVGHPLGDSFHDHVAVGVYEGESDLLGLALFKGFARHHPLATQLRETSGLRRVAAWLAWRTGQFTRRSSGDDRRILDARLRSHAIHARRALAAAAIRIDAGIRRHGSRLAERQLLVGDWSAEVRELLGVLAVAHHADATGDEFGLAAADCWCRLALARVRGCRLDAADHAALAAVGRAVVDGAWPTAQTDDGP